MKKKLVVLSVDSLFDEDMEFLKLFLILRRYWIKAVTRKAG